MPSRSIIAYVVRVYEFGHTKKVINLSEIGTDRHNLLTLFNGYAQAMRDEPERARDPLARRYTPITKIHPSSQTVMVEAEPGYYGLGGSTRDAFTHTERLVHKDGDSPGTPTRVLLTQAPDASVALLFSERVGSMSAGPELMDGFTEAFKLAYKQVLNISFKPVIEPEAWLANAVLEQVIVEDPRFSTDIGNGEDELETKVLGRVEHILKPPKGISTLPRRLLSGLMDGSIHPEQIVNLDFDSPESEPSDRVEELDDDQQSKTPTADRTVKVRVRGENGRGAKTFNLTNPRTPTIAYAFGDGGSQPSDPEFRDACVALIPDLLGEEVDWKDTYHQASKWPDENLEFRMKLPPTNG